MGPWARALLVALGGGEPSALPVDDPQVDDLRIAPSLITARVAGERVTFSAAPIAPGVWAAIEPVPTDVQSEAFAQNLAHTWDEPLVPDEITRAGSAPAVAAVAHAAARAVDADPALLLRWRGYATANASDDEWRGEALPELPAAARRPPDSVPKRLGTSGIAYAGEDLIEAFVRVYDAF